MASSRLLGSLGLALDAFRLSLERDPPTWPYRLIGDTFILISLLLASGIMLKLGDRLPLKSIGFETKGFLSQTRRGFFIGSILILSSIFVGWIASGGKWTYPSGFSPTCLGIAILALILNAAIQEILFRGYLFTIFRHHGGTPLALLLTSLLFSLAHLGQTGRALWPLFNLFLTGLLIGLFRVMSGTLWLPIALHAAWNIFLGPVFGLPLSGLNLDCGWHLLRLRPTVWTGGDFGIEGGWCTTVVLLATFAWIGYLAPRPLFGKRS